MSLDHDDDPDEQATPRRLSVQTADDPSRPSLSRLFSMMDLHQSPSLRQLTWDDRNHWAVLTQLHGSVWPRVLPLCLVNAALCILLHFLELQPSFQSLQSTSTTGHSYVAMVMSFLVVTRVKITYDRYMAQSAALQACYQAVRELCVTACLLTAADPNGQRYRHDVCASAIHLLSVTMQVLDYRSRMYEEEDLRLPMHLATFAETEDSTSTSRTTSPMQRLQQACRVPLTLAFDLRRTIMAHRGDPSRLENDAVWLHPCNEELRLLSLTDAFVKAVGNLEIYMTTPLPFPLVQMTKTFLLVWIFTLPFVFRVTQTSQLVVSCCMIVLITYGFFGLEFVAMELSDCFGDDPSDLDIKGHAEQCFEDCYMSVYKIDGREWAQKLRQTVVRHSLFRHPTPTW